MCIRDSAYVGSAFIATKEANADEAYKRMIVESSAEDIVYTCLLYTSDAADERSSVDLGGRRIIKKKNKKDKTMNT